MRAEGPSVGGTFQFQILAGSLGGIGAANLLKDFGATHVINVTMTTANTRTSANLNPRLSGSRAIFSPLRQDRNAEPHF
jgi:hypothetical protein